jgi:hypothetical protein
MQKLLLEHLISVRHLLLLPLALLGLGKSPAWGQTHPAPRPTDNLVWMDSVQHLSLAQQVVAVQQRAWRDTLLAPYQPQEQESEDYPHGVRHAVPPGSRVG